MSDEQRPKDHEQIRTWAIAKGGYPVLVPMGDDDEGEDDVMAIAFNGEADDTQRIDWSEFFTRFEAEELEFDYDQADDDLAASKRYELRPRNR